MTHTEYKAKRDGILAEIGHSLTGDKKNGYIAKLHLSSAAHALDNLMLEVIGADEVLPGVSLNLYADEVLEAVTRDQLRQSLRSIVKGSAK